MTTKIIDMDIRCPECGGSGVYIGMAERDGAAVVCWKCDGSGKFNYRYQYKEFNGKVKRNDVKRVYLKTGYCVAPKKISFDEIGEIDLSKEGVSYEEFQQGKLPTPIERLQCPMCQDQGACHAIKGFTDRCNELNGEYLCILSSCNYRNNKAECWERFKEGTNDD